MAEEEAHGPMQRSDGAKHLERLQSSGNRNLSYGCTSEEDPTPTCVNDGCEDLGDQPWGFDSGELVSGNPSYVARKRGEAPACTGTNQMPCAVTVTLADIEPFTNELGYCNEIAKCHLCRCHEDRLATDPPDPPLIPPYLRPYDCQNWGNNRHAQVTFAENERPIVDINGAYAWTDFHPRAGSEPDSTGVSRCCFTDLLGSDTSGMFDKTDVDAWEWCYYHSSDGVKSFAPRRLRTWQLHIVMEFRNNSGAIYGDTSRNPRGEFPEYPMGDGVKLSILIPDTATSYGHYQKLCDSGDPNTYDMGDGRRSCFAINSGAQSPDPRFDTIPCDELPDEEKWRCYRERTQYHTMNPEIAWSGANVFRGFIPKDQYRCLGTNVFSNDIQEPVAIPEPSPCIEAGDQRWQIHIPGITPRLAPPRTVIPFYFGGTVTVKPVVPP